MKPKASGTEKGQCVFELEKTGQVCLANHAQRACDPQVAALCFGPPRSIID